MATRRHNQTYAPNGLLYDPITARGQYNNAVVNNGGLLSNGQAAGLHSQTGYMPSKTVGGRYGQPMPGAIERAGVGQRFSNISSGDYFTDNRQGYGPYNFAAAQPASTAREVVPAPTQGLLDNSVGAGRYMIGPRGQIMPTELERSRRRNQAASPEGMANTARLAENREAYQTQRQGLLADRRANVTQIAMNRRSARQDRLAARNAPQQGMGLLEQMAMRDPRNAAQLLAMRQQGLLAQQQMQLQGRRLDQEGMLAQQGLGLQGQRLGLDREQVQQRGALAQQELGLRGQEINQRGDISDKNLSMEEKKLAEASRLAKDRGELDRYVADTNAGIQKDRYGVEDRRYQGEIELKRMEAASERQAEGEALMELGRFEEADAAFADAQRLRGSTAGSTGAATPALPTTGSGLAARMPPGAFNSTGGDVRQIAGGLLAGAQANPGLLTPPNAQPSPYPVPVQQHPGPPRRMPLAAPESVEPVPDGIPPWAPLAAANNAVTSAIGIHPDWWNYGFSDVTGINHPSGQYVRPEGPQPPRKSIVEKLLGGAQAPSAAQRPLTRSTTQPATIPTQPSAGLLAPPQQSRQSRQLTAVQRKQFEPIKHDPEAVVAELRRRGFAGADINRELNAIYGSGLFGTRSRTESNPSGSWASGGSRFVDKYGNVIEANQPGASWRTFGF
jgi:hypothetical protein